MSFPDGVQLRPLRDEDIDELVAMVNQCELVDMGETMLDRADVVGDLATEGLDRERDAVVAIRGDRIVAWGIVMGRRRWIDVHPDARGRGIGTWLMRWSEDRARESGADRIGQTVPDSLTDVISMLTANGYTPRRTSWILCMDHEERPADPEPPDGIRLRPYLPADEVEALTMFEEAFSEWEDRLPSSLPTWRTMVTNREGFQNDDLILAVDGEMIVGGAFMIDADEIWVDKFATHRDYRHRGIARGLLQAAFQRSFDRGYHKTRLSTDSNTGALSFYERIGMVVERSFTHYALDLK